MRFFTDGYLERGQDCLRRAAASGAVAVSLKMVYRERYGCSYEAGRLKTSAASENWQYFLELVRNGRRGTVRGNSLEHLPEMLRRAVALAETGAAAHFDALPPPGTYPEVKEYSPDVEERLTRERLIGDCGAMVEALRRQDDGLDVSAEGAREYGEVVRMNSAGLCHRSRTSLWSLELGFTRVDGQDMLFAGEGRSWRSLGGLYDPDHLVRRNLFDLRHGCRIAAVSPGACPVLLAPEVFSRFLGPVLAGLNGRDVHKGISPLKDKLGARAFDPALTIVDDPLLDFSPDAASMDEHGVPARVCPLVVDGVVQRFLYDYDTACLTGNEPTGHDDCRASRPSVRPGRVSSAELIASLRKGLLVESLLGFGQGNIGNGDFSCNVALGYLVENGEIVGRVKNTMIAGNIFSLLKNDLVISSDVDANSLFPYALLPAVQVASKD